MPSRRSSRPSRRWRSESSASCCWGFCSSSHVWSRVADARTLRSSPAMSIATGQRLLPVAHPAIDHTTLALAAGLLIAASTHLTLAVEHGASTFAVLAAIAGGAQAVLAVIAMRGGARSIAQAAMVLSLVLIQLYALNVTVGLPPVIAHTHTVGTHVVLGL